MAQDENRAKFVNFSHVFFTLLSNSLTSNNSLGLEAMRGGINQ